MARRYLERRYLQFRIILVTTVVCLIAQGVMWFFGLLERIENTWVKWPFNIASIIFIFSILYFGTGSLDLWARTRDRRSLSQDERQVLEKEFYPQLTIFVVGCVLFMFVVYKLIQLGWEIHGRLAGGTDRLVSKGALVLLTGAIWEIPFFVCFFLPERYSIAARRIYELSIVGGGLWVTCWVAYGIWRIARLLIY